MKAFPFEELSNAPLIVSADYKGGCRNNISDEPLSKLLGTENQGGFRRVYIKGTHDLAYVVIYTTGDEPEWPDFLDFDNGIFRYYGDNRKPGHELHDTKKGGNKVLNTVFSYLNDEEQRKRIPPFLIFQRLTGRDVRFLGLAVPGTKTLGRDKELVAFWRTLDGNRFQNYEAYFTILNVMNVSKDWLFARRRNDPNHTSLAPLTFTNYIKLGRVGINPLCSPQFDMCPSKKEQFPDTEDGKLLVESIQKHYAKRNEDLKDNYSGFEKCALEIVRMMDNRFTDFELTRPWRDGGRDVICNCRIGPENTLHPLKVQCAVEAKCFSESTGVGVKHMSRLISRIKYREIGILVTTSYVHSQAYQEVRADGHPILILNAKEIYTILHASGINNENIEKWMDSIDQQGEVYFEDSRIDPDGRRMIGRPMIHS